MVSQLSHYHLLNRESFPHCLFLLTLSKIKWLCVALFLGPVFFFFFFWFVVVPVPGFFWLL
uniref:Macaca fascicularis brain cDNA clone: QflA-21957, similar to human XIAP associated factor-1 (HSXIAPAF1), transcript variant2, mRNA, RefSeq: NM_199139.1 n=1 Tax=Macaca fascicularis TaxID=9541 RepID=I7GDC9_MACFA|nr:unnamed protein product [Macaca fascicularis]